MHSWATLVEVINTKTMEELGYEAPCGPNADTFTDIAAAPCKQAASSRSFAEKLPRQASVNREICVLKMLSHPARDQRWPCSYR